MERINPHRGFKTMSILIRKHQAFVISRRVCRHPGGATAHSGVCDLSKLKILGKSLSKFKKHHDFGKDR